MSDLFESAAGFVQTHARLLERRAFERRFRGGPAEGVLAALLAYRNTDGGLGWALEPDLRSRVSLPVCAEIGLTTLFEADVKAPERVAPLCDFLAGLAAADGLLPAATATGLEAPHAAHWSGDFALAPSLNVTLGVCGLLHFQGVAHPWLARATETCRERLAEAVPGEAHTLRGATRFVDHAPGGRALFDAVAEAIPRAEFFIAEAPVDGYGLTPLHFAPSPESSWASLFSTDQIGGHLDDLAARQQDDGGWPIAWDAPGPAAALEWRGLLTLEAVGVLAAYGRLPGW